MNDERLVFILKALVQATVDAAAEAVEQAIGDGPPISRKRARELAVEAVRLVPLALKDFEL